MKKTILAALVVGAAFHAPQAQAQSGMVFAAQPAGTAFYTIGSGVAKMLGDKLKRRVAVQPYSGSSVYHPLIDSGEATMGFSSTLDTNAFYQGKGRPGLKNLRVIARMWPLRVALMVRANSGIKKVTDLKGKRVTVNLKAQQAMGSVVLAILGTAGLKESDVKSVTVANVVVGAKSLTEGTVDAAFIAVGIPAVKQAHGGIPGGVAYVDMGDSPDASKAMGMAAPGTYTALLRPAPHLPEVKAPIHVVAFDIQLITSAKTPAADVTAILKAINENYAQLQKDYPQLRAGDPKKLGQATNTAPYHPAAIAFFKSQGAWTADNDAREKTFAR